jgi:ABC-type lipoprotein release transport system permease subunit
MGKLLVIYRLALRDIRHRPAQAFLLLIAIAAGAATLTLGLSLQGAASNPYARTRAATSGPDVIATLFTGGSNTPGPAATSRPGTSGGTAGTGQPDSAALTSLEHARGVTTFSGPFPVTWTAFRAGHTSGAVEVEGRGSAASPVDQPKLLQGSWVRPGGVVVEAGFASAFSLHVGDRLNLGGVIFPIVGTAATAAIPAYPDTCAKAEGCILTNQVAYLNPGLVWATQADVQQVAEATSGPLAYYLNLKLSDPAAAPAFADRYNANATPNDPSLVSWQRVRDGDAQVNAKIQLILYLGSWLLAVLAIASVVVLVGGRMAEQTRRVGLLKAVGGTPRLVAALLLAENTLVGLGAAGAGLIAGWLTAPLIDSPGAGLLSSSAAPSLSAAGVALVVALALAVAVIATFLPAVRAASQSTVAALGDSAQSPERSAAVIGFSAKLPPALLLGLRLSSRRPRKLALSAVSVAIATSGLVTMLTLDATAARWSLGPRVTQATAIVAVLLVAQATVNACFIAWTAALEARYPAALARALGATPGQVTTGLTTAFLAPALAGTLLGIPSGIILIDLVKHGGTATLPTAASLAVMIIVTLAVVGVLTAIATRLGARQPVSDVLH